jgi:hypothetical protein
VFIVVAVHGDRDVVVHDAGQGAPKCAEEEEGHEESAVALAHAVVQEGAVVVQLVAHTHIASGTVLGHVAAFVDETDGAELGRGRLADGGENLLAVSRALTGGGLHDASQHIQTVSRVHLYMK